MSVCKAVERVETIGTLDVLRVTLDDVVAYWFYEYAKALEFIGKEVVVSFRDDFYNNQKITAINTIVVPNVVNVLDKHVALRLYSDAEDNLSNLSFRELNIGDEPRNGCIFYVISQLSNASAHADWAEFQVRDKLFRVATLRIWNSDLSTQQIAGHYCVSSVKKTKWGLESDYIGITTTEVPPNPEIVLAEEYITQYFADDVSATDYINNNALINAIKAYVDYESGYALCRMAMELCMCEQLQNVSNDINIKVLSHAILASYGHCATPNLPVSKETASIMLATRSKWPKLSLMLSILDPGKIDKEPEERDIYRRLKELVDSIIVSKKTYRN